MKKTISLSIFALALMSCNNAFGMLSTRACRQPHLITKIGRRWCNKMSPEERIEYIRSFGGANYSIEKILNRNDQAIMIMLEQNRIGQRIIAANLTSIGNLKSYTSLCEIYDITEGIELFDQLEKRLTKVDKVDQSFE